MKVFLEHIKNKTVPHEVDLLRDLLQAGVPFYDGCLIVQVHDHKSTVQANNAPKPAANANSNTTTVSTIHNHTPYLTPSTATYPKSETQPEADGDAGADGKSTEKASDDKENMPAPSLPTNAKTQPPPKPRVFTTVLFPTAQSQQTDLLILATTPRAVTDGKDDAAPPSTPLTAGPQTASASMPPPAKRQKRESMEIDGSNIRALEGQILVATYPDIDLEPSLSKEETIARLEKGAKSHPRHCEPPPEPKARKRTVAEMAADQALIADQERYMLFNDERLGPSASGAQGATAGGDGEIRAAFEPRFERLQVIMDIKRQHAEKKEKERIQQAENQKRLEAQRQQQQIQEQHAAAQRHAEQERARREAAQREALARQQQQEAQRKAMVAQAAKQKQQQQQQQQQAKNLAQAQNAKAAAAKAKAAANTASNANAAQNAAHANGMQSAQATPRFHQQVAQPQAASPVMRQGTPHSMSSPMVGGVAMQPSTSNMAGSPPRPPSAVQTHTPMAAPMSHSMSARGSQQSHHAGTPRMANNTPNMAQTTPINRPANLQTPRLSQAGSPPAMMPQGSQMGQMMGNQGMAQQGMSQNPMAAQLVAQQKRLLAQQQMNQAAQSGMMGNLNFQNLTPQQQQQLLQQNRIQQLLMQQQQQQQQQGQHQQQQQHQPQQQRNGMMNPLAQQYVQSMNQMQGQLSPHMQMQIQQRMNQMNQQQQQNQMGNQMGRGVGQSPGMMGNGGSPVNMQAAMIQMQQQQQQAAQQNQNQQLQQQVQARGQMLYRGNILKIAHQYGGAVENIPAEVHEKFKSDCLNRARAQVVQLNQARMQQAAMQQQQQQLAMQQGMMGGHQGM